MVGKSTLRSATPRSGRAAARAAQQCRGAHLVPELLQDRDLDRRLALEAALAAHYLEGHISPGGMVVAVQHLGDETRGRHCRGVIAEEALRGWPQVCPRRVRLGKWAVLTWPKDPLPSSPRTSNL